MGMVINCMEDFFFHLFPKLSDLIIQKFLPLLVFSQKKEIEIWCLPALWNSLFLIFRNVYISGAQSELLIKHKDL